MEIKHTQGSLEWLAWRSEGIGGSDAPIILDISPYKTRYELFKEKVEYSKSKTLPENGSNDYVKQLGHELEHKARDYINESYKVEFVPACFQSDENTFIKASLDGVYRELIWEGKYMGQKNFDEVAKTNRPLPHHYPQIQHQMYCSNTLKCIYAAYTADKEKLGKITMVTVDRDEDYIKDLVQKEKDFWQAVQNGEGVEVSEKDYVEPTTDILKEELIAYRDIKKKLEELQKMEKALRESIFNQVTHPKLKYENISVTTRTQRGTIDYKKCDSVDFEQFRKPDKIVKTIRINWDK